MKNIVVFLLLVCLVSACSQDQSKPMPNVGIKKFFDLKGYFKKEIEVLNGSKGIRKRVTTNGKTEERVLDSLNFENEFALFEQSDINRPAWLDKYKIDTVRIENDSTRAYSVSYLAKEEKLKTKELTVVYTKDKEVAEINIVNSDKSLFSSMQQTLFYRPKKKYTVSSSQKFWLSKPANITVEVFLKL
jgi:hypothetical protein